MNINNRVVLGADCESHLSVRGNQTPPMVCKTLWGRGDAGALLRELVTSHVPDTHYLIGEEGEGVWVLLDATGACLLWPHIIGNDDIHLVGHNYLYDLGLMMNEAGCVTEVFEAIDAVRISDTGIREVLCVIANGDYDYDATVNVRKGAYNLASLVQKRLGIDLGKEKVSIPSGFKGDPWKWVCEKQKCGSCDLEPWLGIGHPRNSGRDCEECEGFGLSGPFRLRYCQLSGVPLADWPARAVSYAVDDSKWAEMVFELQGYETEPDDATSPLIDGDTGLYVNEAQQMEGAIAMHLMSLWGPRTNPEAVKRTVAMWQKSADRCFEIGVEMGFVRPSGSKKGSVILKELKARIQADYEARDLEVPRNPPTEKMLEKGITEGSIRYAKEILDACTSPMMREYATHTTYKMNMSKYAYILEAGTTTPVTSRPGFLIATGRSSWSKPPMQGPPAEGNYRESHEPRAGWAYGHGDVAAAELVSQAQNLLDWDIGDTLAKKINAGMDLHVDLACDELGISYEEGMKMKAENDPVMKAARDRGKTGNFGFWGMMIGETLVDQEGTEVFVGPNGTREEAIAVADELRLAWLRKNPEAKEYFKWIKSEIKAGGGSYTLSHLMSGRLRTVDRATKGANSYFQGRTADGMKLGIYWLAREAYTDRESVLFGARPWLLLHDEVIAEFKREQAQAGVVRMCDILTEAMEVLIPDVKVVIDPILARNWSKFADPVYVGGKLVPWENWKRSGDTFLWSPATGPRRGWHAREVSDGSVRVYDGPALVRVFDDGDMKGLARHTAECFLLGEESWL